MLSHLGAVENFTHSFLENQQLMLYYVQSASNEELRNGSFLEVNYVPFLQVIKTYLLPDNVVSSRDAHVLCL